MARTPLIERPLAFIDTETTGLDPLHNEVIEVAIIREWPDGRIEEWATKVAMQNPDKADDYALKINGYFAHPELWEGAPTFDEIAAQVAAQLDDCVLVGHNCLSGSSNILLADGNTMRLSKMVSQQHPGPVLSLDEMTGEIVARNVVGWVQAGSKPFNEWRRIQTQGKGTLHLTNDHEVITERGRVRADGVQVGDRVQTARPCLNQSQLNLLWGTIAGDATLSKRASDRSWKLQVGHKPEAYIRFKEMVLGSLVSSVAERPNDRGYGEGTDHTLWVLQTHNDARFQPFAESCLDLEGVKGLTPHWLEHMDPASLAIWFCDDGGWDGGSSRRASICVHALGGRRAADLITPWMQEKGWPASTHVRPDGYTYVRLDGAGRWKDENGINDFWSTIAPYIPECMAHKIPPHFRTLIQESLWDVPTPSTISWADVVVDVGPLFLAEGVEKTSRYGARVPPPRRKGETQYCLTVEGDGNFFASGLCVSNCSFDLDFLDEALRRAKSPAKLSHRKLDTYTLAYEHLAYKGLNSLSLDSICTFLGISNEGNHTALVDARRCREVWHTLLRHQD